MDSKSCFVLLLPLVIIGFMVHDEVKLYREPQAVDNYILTGYFDKHEGRYIYLDSCSRTHKGIVQSFDRYLIPDDQLDSVVLDKMAKDRALVTVLFRYDRESSNRGLQRYTRTKIIRISKGNAILYEYDYPKALRDGMIMILVTVVLSVLFYVWILRGNRTKSS